MFVRFVVLSADTKRRIGHVFNIAIPTGLQGCLDILNTLIVMYFVSELSNELVGAYGIGFGYLSLFFPVCSILYVGTNYQVSFSFGKGDFAEVSRISCSMFISSMVCSVPVAIFAHSLATAYVNWLDLGEQILRLSTDLSRIAILSLPSLMVKNVITSILVSTGDARVSMNIKTIITLLSILCNYLLVKHGLGFSALGVYGPMYINVSLSYLELLSLFTFIVLRRNIFKIPIRWAYKYMVTGLSVGFPTGLERLFTMASLSLILKFVATYGDNTVIGFQTGTRIEALSFIPGFGFMVAAMVLVGRSLGSGSIREAREYVKTIAIVSGVIMGILGLFLSLLSHESSSIFIKNNTEAIYISTFYLLAMGLSQLPLVLVFIYDGALRGARMTNMPLIINCSCITILRIIPMWICVNLNIRVEFIFAIIFAETYVRATVFYLVFRSRIWSRRYAN